MIILWVFTGDDFRSTPAFRRKDAVDELAWCQNPDDYKLLSKKLTVRRA